MRVSRIAGGRSTLLKTVTLADTGAYRFAFRPSEVGTWVLVTSYRTGDLSFTSKAVRVDVHS